MSDPIASRKEEHVRLCIERDVRHRGVSSGFEHWRFEHNALPELRMSDIDCSARFLGKHLSFPLLVSGMTGGYPGALAINGALASVCEAERVALGAGSMRRALVDDSTHDTYKILRRNAPSIPILANIGAAEVAQMAGTDDAQRLVDLIEADALAVHCNPLQELLQPEGTPNFRGVLAGIARLVRALSVPLIVKEVGAGISADVARRLFDVGVTWFDVAGAGGTSWAGVEILRRQDDLEIASEFWDWGIPTAEALLAVRHTLEASESSTASCRIIASGGITNGVQIAKSIALGASLAGAARPMLEALSTRGEEGLRARLRSWKNDLGGVMFLVGASSIDALRHAPIRHVPTASTSTV